MRRILILVALAAFLACSGDDTGTTDAKVTIDPAVAHEVVACDTASWQVANPGQPDGYTCERACQVYVTHSGPSCTVNCPGKPIPNQCQSTFEYEGLTGCCYGDGMPFKFCECQ